MRNKAFKTTEISISNYNISKKDSINLNIIYRNKLASDQGGGKQGEKNVERFTRLNSLRDVKFFTFPHMNLRNLEGSSTSKQATEKLNAAREQSKVYREDFRIDSSNKDSKMKEDLKKSVEMNTRMNWSLW